jgi:hypothetical protein
LQGASRRLNVAPIAVLVVPNPGCAPLKETLMTRTLPILGAAALLLVSAPAFAAGHGGGPNSSQMGTSQTTTTTQPTMMHGPSQTGQPNQSCGSSTAPNTPGNAASAPGSAFNPDGNAGTKYAGQQPQNSNNTASVSQYDAACSHQPH